MPNNKRYKWPLAALAGILILASAAAIVLIKTGDAFSPALAANSASLKAAAASYLQNKEKTGAPVALEYDGQTYYYIPVEINKKISQNFAGAMLDADGAAVSDEMVLRELYKYPGLILEFADTAAAFNKAADKKSKAIANYCKIIFVERTKLEALWESGEIGEVLYKGLGVMMDGVGLAQGVAKKTLLSLSKELAKKAAQDKVQSAFLPTDTREILDNIKRAHDLAEDAAGDCALAKDAWLWTKTNIDHPVPLTRVENATLSLRNMFQKEAESMANLRESIKKINSYPSAMTKINKNNYKKAIADMDKLVSRLEKEADYWDEEYNRTVARIDEWVAEQVSRAGKMAPAPAAAPSEPAAPAPVSTPAPAPASALRGSCADVDLSADYKLYTYTVDTPGYGTVCNGYKNNISSRAIGLRCSSGAARWRNYFVKEVDVVGLNTLKITADLGLNDHSRFFTECGGKGVKYDNYSSLIVLSADPRPILNAECDKTCSVADWPKCAVQPTGTDVLGTCGVSKCSVSKNCDFSVSVNGLNKIYLVYHISDAWPADLEGTMANARICGE